jgi:endonuclease-3
MAKMLINEFNGLVPSEPELLRRLPGVGRKTAHVIASVAFRKPVMAVDTHVMRVSKRIGLVINAKTPLEVEKQLTANIPAHMLYKAHHWLILHGRYVCKARNPLCSECGLREFCKYYHSEKT